MCSDINSRLDNLDQKGGGCWRLVNTSGIMYDIQYIVYIYTPDVAKGPLKGCDTSLAAALVSLSHSAPEERAGAGLPASQGVVSELCEQEQLHQGKGLCWKLL